MTCQYVVMGSFVNYYSPIEVAAGDTMIRAGHCQSKGNGWHYTCYLLGEAGQRFNILRPGRLRAL